MQDSGVSFKLLSKKKLTNFYFKKKKKTYPKINIYK